MIHKIDKLGEFLNYKIGNAAISAQSDLVIEECSELTKEIIKDRRGVRTNSSIFEEGCDVILTVYTLLRMYAYTDEAIIDQIEEKIKRTINKS